MNFQTLSRLVTGMLIDKLRMRHVRTYRQLDELAVEIRTMREVWMKVYKFENPTANDASRRWSEIEKAAAAELVR